MQANPNRFGGFLNHKDALGFIGVAGDLVGIFVKIPGTIAITIFLISSLFILVWGLISSKGETRSFKKALAWVGIIVGGAVIVYFAVIGIILVTMIGSPPDSSGRPMFEEVQEFNLNSSQTTDQLTGQYSLKFSREANLIEVGVAPKVQDTDLVKELYVTTRGLPNHTNSMALWANKTTDIETYYKVINPPPDFDVILNSTVQLKQARPSPSITIRVYNKYFRRDLLWRVEKWVYERYGE